MTKKPTWAELDAMYEEMFVAERAYEAELERTHGHICTVLESRYNVTMNHSTEELRNQRAAYINCRETYLAAYRESQK